MKKKLDIFYSLGIFLVVITIFSPLVFFGGFHNTDDFHFFRKYSTEELIQVWYSNYNLTGLESDGYRPLTVWTDHFLYTILGFNPRPFMFTIAILNGLYAVLVYQLARHFLERSYAALVAMLAVLLPQTLFKFTFATAIYATILFGLMILAYDFLLRWYKTGKKRYFYLGVLTAVLASLYKENGYCVLVSSPLVVLAFFWHQKKKKWWAAFKSFTFWLPIIVLIILLVIRHYALLVFPERLNRGLPPIEFGLTKTFFNQLINWFYIFGNRHVAILLPAYRTFLKPFLERYYNQFFFQVFRFLIYVLLIIFTRKLLKKKEATLVLLLFIFLSISLIPTIFIFLNRLMIVPYTLSLILIMIFFQFLQRQLFKNRFWTKAIILGFFSLVVFFFGKRVFWYIVENNRYSPHTLKVYREIRDSQRWKELDDRFDLIAQRQYVEERLPEVENLDYLGSNLEVEDDENSLGAVKDSFEQGLLAWETPNYCSGKGLIELSDQATEGKKSLSLTSEAELLCMSRSFELKKRQIYRVSFDAKLLEGDNPAELHLNDSYGELKPFYSQLKALDNQWEKHLLIFSPRLTKVDLYLSCLSNGEKNTILYDNLKVERVIITGPWHYAFTTPPAWVYLPLFEAPYN